MSDPRVRQAVNTPTSGDRSRHEATAPDVTVRAPGRLARFRVRALRVTVNALFALLTRPTYRGLENIPASGPCLLVFNHVSNLDPPLIFGQIKRHDLTALVASEYRANGFYRRAIEWAGGSWIRRGASDRAALRFAVNAMQQGWIVGIAPEGGRSKSGQLRDGKPGPSFLAIHAGAPLLPVGLTGTGSITASLKRLRRAPISVTFGPLFTLPAQQAGSHKQHLQECTTEIMCQLAALLPADARGVYADSPRLHELLTDQRHDRAFA